MNLVIICSRFPYPLYKGDRLRLYHQIKSLAIYHQITLISLDDHKITSKQIEALQPYCRKIYTFPFSLIQRFKNSFFGLVHGLPLNVAYFYDPKIHQKISRIIHQLNPDVIYSQLIRTSEYVKNIPTSKYLDLMDAFSLRLKRKVQLQKSFRFFWRKEFKRVLQYEQTIHRHFDGCFIISKTDRDFLEANGVPNLTILSNGVDTEYFYPLPNKEKKYDLAFVGNLSYEPNIEAAKYLAKKILPELIQHKSDIRVLICGSNPKKEILSLKSQHVEIKANVPDIRAAYRQSKLFVAPIFLGSGIQNKILEAMACGLPCITTSQVIDAIEIPGSISFAANNINTFVQHIQALLSNPDLSKISKESRSFVKEHYSWQSNNQNLSIIDMNYGKRVPIK